MTRLAERPAWKALQAHYATAKALQLRDLFAADAKRGERFTLVSDGVVEAENAQRELFGFDRTCEISMKPATEIAAAAQAWGQNDDITVVTVRRNS